MGPRSTKGLTVAKTTDTKVTWARDPDDCIEILVSAIDAYIIPLAGGRGHNDAAFGALCRSLDRCAARWASSDLVPRSLANLCVSLPPMVENISFQYAGEAADKIRDAWLQLDQIVTESVLPWSG